MALTQVKTNAIADDAVTTDKLANAINTERTANTAKVSLTDNSVTLAKMAGGTDGQIITYDASGDPVAVGPGTDGQVLTSTGAGSPPAFETLPTSGATLSGSTDNTVVTVTGANAMQGESNFKYDGTDIDLESSSDFNIHMLKTSVADGWIRNIGNLDIAAASGGANGQKVTLSNGANEAGLSAKLTVESGGDITVNTGNLVIGTSGKGIDFSATSDGSGTDTSELLDDYEEGTWTPTLTGDSNPTLSYTNRGQGGGYIKVGHMLTCWFYSEVDTVSSDGSGALYLSGLPYAAASYTIGGESASTAGWMRVGTTATGEHKEPYWRNISQDSKLLLQYRNDSDGGQSSPSAAASVPNNFFSIGYIHYRCA